MGKKIIEKIRSAIHTSSLSAIGRMAERIRQRKDTKAVREKFDAFDENVVRVDIVDVREGWDGEVKTTLGFYIRIQIIDPVTDRETGDIKDNGIHITTGVLTTKAPDDWDVHITVSWRELKAIESGRRMIEKGPNEGRYCKNWKASYALHQRLLHVDAKEGVLYYTKIPDIDEIFGYIKDEKIVDNVEGLIAAEEKREKEDVKEG